MGDFSDPVHIQFACWFVTKPLLYILNLQLEKTDCWIQYGNYN